MMENRLLEIKDVKIVLKCDFCEASHACEIDPGYVTAALMNIFDNAVEACRRSEVDRVHEITFSVFPENNHIVFALSDTGIGMDEETQAKLFTVFFSSKGREGTGLGLFISQKIIEQHHGTISVSSSPGRGSRFVIKLPKKSIE